VDKPLAPDAASAQELADLARSSNRQLHVFQNRRWDSDFLTLRDVVTSGGIGTPHRLESRFERLRTQLSGGWRESARPDDQGGVLVDFGAHLVDQALALLGPVELVTASARSVRATDIANDDAQMLLTHTSGAVSYLSGSSAAAFGQPRFLLLGTNGGCRIDLADSQEAQLRAGLTPRDPEFGIEPAESHASVQIAAADGTVHTVNHQDWPRAQGQWRTYYQAVRDAITVGTPAPVPVDDVIANLRVLDAAAESARTASTVRLDPPAGHAAGAN
ncbi:MAG: Gfo/Idh/MocA family oxidoreductase, partial [Actinomycetales bacterium]